MRFGRALRESAAAAPPQWRACYCDYERLQHCVQRCIAGRQIDETSSSSRPPLPADFDFLAVLVGQIEVSEQCYRAQLDDLTQRAAVLLQLVLELAATA